MGKECGMVQVLALAESLAVKVNIEYMDGRELGGGKLTTHEFGPETSRTVLTLLYRPGHYDILYMK
jgi:ubiquitin thioesterase protein OTUB1